MQMKTTLVVDGARINVLEQGKGASLVFLHYFGGSSNSWSEVIDQLQGQAHCVALDLPGFGDSEAIASDTVEDSAHQLAEVIRQLNLKHYILIGHSMGGKIALAFAATQPLGLQSLVLLAPSPPTPEPMAAAERSRLLNTHGDRAAAELTADKITFQPLNDAVFNQVIQDNLRSSQTAWQAWLECGSRQDISAAMLKITVPVFIGVGEFDSVFPQNLLQQEVVERLTNPRLVVVPNAGHLLPIEAPQAVVDLIQSARMD